MAVIMKKDEKAEAILCQMENLNDPEEFGKLFKEQYSDDYNKIVATYNKEERTNKKVKGHPMPPPAVYLRNMYNVALAKHKKDYESI